jgi:hypothetical protein
MKTKIVKKRLIVDACFISNPVTAKLTIGYGKDKQYSWMVPSSFEPAN